MAGPHVIPDDSSSIGASSHDSSTCHPSQPPESEGDLNILRDAPVTTDFSKPSGHTVIPQEPPPATAPDTTTLTLGDQRLLMEYHERLGHCSWDILTKLAELGILPKRLAKCPRPKCPGCLYGKAHRRPWRTKAKRQKKIKVAKFAGDVVSVDQLESSLPGMVPQPKGSLTNRRYKGATVFVDHFSGLTYVHLMESISGDETVQAKEAFERYAADLGIKIRHYHADNGRFAEKSFTKHIRLS